MTSAAAKTDPLPYLRPRTGHRSATSPTGTKRHPNARSRWRPNCPLKKQVRKKPVRVGGSGVSKCNGLVRGHGLGRKGGKFLRGRHLRIWGRLLPSNSGGEPIEGVPGPADRPFSFSPTSGGGPRTFWHVLGPR